MCDLRAVHHAACTLLHSWYSCAAPKLRQPCSRSLQLGIGSSMGQAGWCLVLSPQRSRRKVGLRGGLAMRHVYVPLNQTLIPKYRAAR